MLKTSSTLVEALRQRQRREKLTDIALAGLLGVNHSTWSRIKSGDRRPGVKVLNAILRLYPEMSPLVSHYIANRNNHDEEPANV